MAGKRIRPVAAPCSGELVLGLVQLLLTSEPLASLYASAATDVEAEAFADPTKGLALPFSDD